MDDDYEEYYDSFYSVKTIQDVPAWMIDLCYKGASEEYIVVKYREYRGYLGEGYSRNYALVHMGLADPYED